MNQYLLYRWYGALRYKEISRTTETEHHLTGNNWHPHRIHRDDAAIVAIAPDRRTVERWYRAVKPLDDAFHVRQREAEEAFQQTCQSAAADRDAAIREVVDT